MSAPRVIERLAGPVDADVVVPGSKSITNRALLAAALADGTSVVENALEADDTEAMLEAIVALGARVVHDRPARRIEVVGTGGALPEGARTLDARQSGTTGRFLLPVLGCGPGTYHLTGDAQLLERPLAGGVEAVRRLGAQVEEHEAPDHLPVTIHGASTGHGEVAIGGDVSSQVISGLLLAAPLRPGGLIVSITGDLVSRPYVELTRSVLAAFGVTVRWEGDHRLVVEPGGYRATRLRVEPDATAASYFFAAAAALGGRVRVLGLGARSQQGDAAFVDVLAAMGAEVAVDDEGTTVRGTGALHGVEVDLGDLSDTAPTLAALAPLADGPTRITGIGFIRDKESDRIGDVARELRRCGVQVEEEPDGMTIHPGAVAPTEVQTYRDHRIAMSFSVLGLATGGLSIADPGCVAKTFPDFFEVLGQLGGGGDEHDERASRRGP